MPKQRVGLRRELAGAPRTREGFSRTFLLRFICEKHTLSFRYAELDALLAAHGVDPRAAYAAPAGGAAGAGADPYVAVAFPSAACCAEVVSKAILVRDALEEARRGFYKDALPFRGRVRLKGADEQFRILEV
ncbi:tRNA (guanine-N2-)-methyltransferase [Aureococcus anophagefferens]|nr:tRNA (guanine-N2-)-methyltransferase [Aureococcus anophagefferens]